MHRLKYCGITKNKTRASEYFTFSRVRLVYSAQNNTNGVYPMLKKKPTYEELEHTQYEEELKTSQGLHRDSLK